MRRFFNYFGSKYRLAELYGKPELNVVMEPFAGSAGYSTYWNVEKAILIEKNPTLAGIWRFLISATPDDIMDMPVTYDLREFPKEYPQVWRDYIGLCIGQGDTAPRNYISEQNMATINDNQFRLWGRKFKERIAQQVTMIKNWEIIEGDYFDAPDIRCWHHVDPPYQHLGGPYKVGFKQFQALAEWCGRRKGVVDVCESEGADWLPFTHLRRASSQQGSGYSEVVCRMRDGTVCNDEFNRQLALGI